MFDAEGSTAIMSLAWTIRRPSSARRTWYSPCQSSGTGANRIVVPLPSGRGESAYGSANVLESSGPSARRPLRYSTSRRRRAISCCAHFGSLARRSCSVVSDIAEPRDESDGDQQAARNDVPTAVAAKDDGDPERDRAVEEHHEQPQATGRRDLP